MDTKGESERNPIEIDLNNTASILRQKLVDILQQKGVIDTTGENPVTLIDTPTFKVQYSDHVGAQVVLLSPGIGGTGNDQTMFHADPHEQNGGILIIGLHTDQPTEQNAREIVENDPRETENRFATMYTFGDRVEKTSIMPNELADPSRINSNEVAQNLPGSSIPSLISIREAELVGHILRQMTKGLPNPTGENIV